MALRRRSKVSLEFSMASMTDIVFLLLIFFMITSTVVHPNALKLLLPKSSNQTVAKPIITVSITENLDYYLDKTPISLDQLELALQQKLSNVTNEEQCISLHVDKSVPMEAVVKVMNIAKDNKYKLILATAPE